MSIDHTYRMEDIEEAFAGRKAVVWIDPFHTSYSEKHPNGRPKSKEDIGFVDELRVIC